ncbi:hypothetical protein F8M41_010689 [Gigaspora margarita]|uniref:Uncharacterized protein n=1 Tax=Gigaspora margarita TaxID=4874 RepID=A0A8H4A0U4_GIGMA|nr:hypothetical protein F8M41_010689 [Gigaspora margarita]
MDQENSFTLRYKLENTSNNILEHNSAPIVPYEFSLLPHSFDILLLLILNILLRHHIPLESSSCNLEYVASSSNLEYIDSSPNLEYVDSSLILNTLPLQYILLIIQLHYITLKKLICC